MSTSCGVFWDIQNIDIPKKSSADTVVSLIKTKIIEKYNLIRRDFYVVGGYNTIKVETVNRLKSLGADFEEAGPGRNAADEKIKQRMFKFINRFRQKCSIILITGDSGIGKPLKGFRENPFFKVYLIRLEHSFGDGLEQLADRIFLLGCNSLEQVYVNPASQVDQQDSFSEFRTKYFVRITSEQYFSPKILSEIRNDLSSYGGTFAIVTSAGDIWCAFDDISHARSALDLKGRYNYQSKVYNIDVNIKPATQEVINLMECAKLSYRQLVANRTFNMSQYKVKNGNPMDHKASTSGTNSENDSSGFNDWMETINNVSETFNNMQSIYSTIKSSSANRPTNSRSNYNDGEGCKQS